MDLQVTELPDLPRLAWLARIDRARPVVHVVCGPSVEYGDTYAVEGCWSDRFDPTRLVTSQIVTGTGLVLGEGTVRFVTPSDTTQAIYEFRSQQVAVYSNSLALLLESAGLDLHAEYPYYDTDLISIFLGLRRYRRQIPTVPGPVHVHYHCQIETSQDLNARVVPRPHPPRFPDFSAYAAYLSEQSHGLAINALDQRRKTRYRPLATVSSGYDSPCCAVLARQSGCGDAITFSTARDGFEDRNDSGAEIARRLGLTVGEFEPDEYRQSSCSPEIEFIASGYGADDVIYSAARDVLRDRLLFTGYHGDRVWSPNRHYATDQIARGDPSGGSLLEFRLATGFQNLPLPFAGCLNHRDIAEVSNAAEMTPWRVGGDYDRPIPRRIVETAGIPRSLFGSQKKAAAIPYQGTGGTMPPREFLSEASYASFREFLDMHHLMEALPSQRHKVLAGFCKSRVVASYKVGKLLEFNGVDSFEYLKWRYSKHIGEASFLFHWAVARQRASYRRALKGGPARLGVGDACERA